jgi:hypothetical protein
MIDLIKSLLWEKESLRVEGDKRSTKKQKGERKKEREMRGR